MFKMQGMLSRASVTVVVAVGVVLASLAGAVSSSSAQEVATVTAVRVKIATNYVRENGCHETTQSFTTQVPNVERLDRSYHGVLDGIEVVETTGNNGHANRNFTWVNNGSAISYQLYAKGAGFWIDPPRIFGVQVGGGYCHGAAGGSEGIEIYAHYKAG
jgi:hypothetical protein